VRIDRNFAVKVFDIYVINRDTVSNTLSPKIKSYQPVASTRAVVLAIALPIDMPDPLFIWLSLSGTIMIPGSYKC
jgi:hypothetical protein